MKTQKKNVKKCEHQELLVSFIYFQRHTHTHTHKQMEGRCLDSDNNDNDKIVESLSLNKSYYKRRLNMKRKRNMTGLLCYSFLILFYNVYITDYWDIKVHKMFIYSAWIGSQE